MVSIDTVYQKVLAIANKEQRGYITPQEFNLLANKAQMEIFELYFVDEDKFRRVASNDTVYSDNADKIREKIDNFEKFEEFVNMGNGGGIGILPDHYRIGNLTYRPSTVAYTIDKVDQNEIRYVLSSSTLAPTETRPVYTRFSITQDDQDGRERRIQIYPTTIVDNVFCNYIAKPKDPKWAHVIVNEQALYDSSRAVHFELHSSEEENLVNRILQLSGVIVEDQQLQQSALLDRQLELQQKNS